jgi:hypothetical protein
MALMQGNQGQTGKVVGQNLTAGLGEYTDVLVTEFLARYYQLNYRGQVFFAANTAAQALSVASGTYTGLVVANPAGSGKNLVMLDAQFALSLLQTGFSAIVLGTAPTVALTTGSSTGPSGTSCLVGSGSASVAKVGASCTFGAAPTIMRALAGAQWVTTGTTSNVQAVKDEIAGLVIVAPGQAFCIEAVTTAVTGLASMTWAEVAI